MVSQAVLKTLIYADLFDFPLKFEELVKFLIFSSRIDRSLVKKELSRVVNLRLVEKKEGFYFLRGRQGIVSLRQKREKWSIEKIKIARKITAILKSVPWIQAVLLTGALACRNCEQEDDIDCLIITSKERLWLTRFFTVLILEILGWRRRPQEKKIRNKLCLNMFLSKDCLALPENERDLFTAHEVLQTQLLWQRNNSYLSFIKANRWVGNYLANAYSEILEKEKKRGKIDSKKRNNSCFFDFLERLVFLFQTNYMKPRRTIEVVESSRALFHPQDSRSWVMREYNKRISNLPGLASRPRLDSVEDGSARPMAGKSQNYDSQKIPDVLKFPRCQKVKQ